MRQTKGIRIVYLFTLLFWRFAIAPLAAQEADIYAVDTPVVVNVWSRVGDFSPLLRSVESVALSPDGKRAVSVSKFDGKIMVWRVADGFLQYDKALEAEIECVVFSPDGQRFATGGEDFYVRVYEATTGRELLRFLSDSSFDGIAWSHDGKTIAGGTEKGEVILLDATSLKVRQKIKVGSTVNSMQFTRDDSRLLLGGNIQTPDPQTKKTIYTGFVRLLDMKTNQVIRSYGSPQASVKSVRMTSDEKLLAAGSFDNAAYVFEVETGKLVHKFQEPKKIEAVAFSPNGHFLMVGGHQKCIVFYRLSDFQLVYKLPTPRTEYIDVSADGRLMLTGHEDSGLVSLHLFLSDMQDKGALYQQLENKLLRNKDLKND